MAPTGYSPRLELEKNGSQGAPQTFVMKNRRVSLSSG